MATKNYNVGPQDGWLQVVTGVGTAINLLRISAYPYTHPIQVYGGTAAPAATDLGIRVCHKPFFINVAANGDTFWVKSVNPLDGSPTFDGRIRIDVYSQGGVLS